MRTRLVWIAALLAAAPAVGGQWIAVDRPARARAPFAPVPLYWFRVVRTPWVYRTVVDVPAGVDRATAMLKTSGYVYVCVDGREVYAWGAEKDSAERPRIGGEPDRAHELDLTEQLTPGRHVLTVSAPPGAGDVGGFVIDGGLYKGTKRLAELGSDKDWTVTAYRPTTLVDARAIMTLGYTGRAEKGVCTAAEKVRTAGVPWKADEDALAAAYFKAELARLRRDLADATWRLELLTKKGLYVVGDSAHGWGGPERPDIASAVSRAGRLLGIAPRLGNRIDRLAARPADGVEQLGLLLGELGVARQAARILLEGARSAARSARDADERKAMRLAAAALAAKAVVPAEAAKARTFLAGLARHPLGRLNESRHDRLGWLPHPHLADSDLGRWGVRIHPVTGPTKLRLGPRWRFSTDPKKAGLAELRHTIGYNIENQWPWIDGRQSWTKNKAFPGYKGVAWYRGRLFVPAEWAGNGGVLRLRVAGKGRLWLNDRELPAPADGRPASLAVPADAILFGSENYLAVRVEAVGADRGLLGPTELTCPALDAPAAKAAPPVDVLATPLSPCAVLTPRTRTLHIHHAGKAELLLPGSTWQGGYAEIDDGKLKANWVLLWLAPTAKTGVQRPILLVFQNNPSAVTCRGGLTEVLLAAAGGRVVAVRPWAKRMPARNAKQMQPALALWSRAALAVPVNYMSVTGVLKKGESWQGISVDNVPAGPVLEHHVVYDYLVTADQWATRPLKLAPLPALCSLAIDSKFRGLTFDPADRAKLETFQDGGIAGPYRCLRDTDCVTYSYPVEPWPRLVGFTSWMFSGVDTGVPGNEREMETIAATGANSFRPQHNNSDHRAGRLDRNGRWTGPYPQSEKRTRVQILADFCRDNGVNYMNNIDQTLGKKREFVRTQYDTWVKDVLFPHFDKLVPQLADRPFWQVAYDLINEPFDHRAAAYNRTTKALTARIRRIDRRHLLYIEPCQAWGAIQQLRLIEPTGDPLTVYSFHDYNFRMRKASDRWPTQQRDLTTICRMWWPAFEFAVTRGLPMHCGEYGGFASATDDALCQKTLLNDLYRLFDQFGMHHHYYTGRGIYRRQLDGSLRASNVVKAFREYSRRKDLNLYYKLWDKHPAAGGAR